MSLPALGTDHRPADHGRTRFVTCRTFGGCNGRCAFGPPAASRPCRAGSTHGSVRWNRDAASAWPCPPA